LKIAFDITGGHEGGYANDASDLGGETYRGIARKFHPSWAGWAIIDRYTKPRPNFDPARIDRILSQNPELDALVLSFYRVEFWNKFGGDNIADQAVANELYDTAVNMSPGRAITFMQRSLNFFNRNQQDYPDIKADGKWGPNTAKTLHLHLAKRGNKYILLGMNVLQGYHYIEQGERHPDQEKWAAGWFNRVELAKT